MSNYKQRKLGASLIIVVLLLGVAVLPTSAQKPTTELDVTPSNMQGWIVDSDGAPIVEWIADPGAPLGDGYLRMSIDPAAPNEDKFIMHPAYLQGTPVLDFVSFEYSFYIDPTSTQGSEDLYINIYVDQVDDGLGEFYDCRYDFLVSPTIPSGSPGWYSASFDNTTVIPVTDRDAGDGVNCPATLGGFVAGDIFTAERDPGTPAFFPGAMAVNGGQSNGSDNGLVGGYDQIIIETSNEIRIFDFEPEPPDLSVIKSVELFTDVDGDGQYDPGDTFNFAITVSYVQGSAPVTDIFVSDLLPPGVTLTSPSTTMGSYDPNTGIWSGLTLSALDPTAVLNLMGTVNPGTEGQTITNVAALSSSNPPDSNAVNDSASASFTVAALPPTAVPPTPPPPPPPPPSSGGDSGQPQISVFDPSISKLGTLLPGQVGVTGEQLRWDVSVSNFGSVNGDNVVVTDTLPASLSLDRVEAPGASVNVNGNTVSVTYAVLAPGQTLSFQIYTTVLQGSSIVDNTACVTANNLSDNRCVTASALGGVPGQLPATGESPAWRNPVLAAAAAALLGLGLLLLGGLHHLKPR